MDCFTDTPVVHAVEIPGSRILSPTPVPSTAARSCPSRFREDDFAAEVAQLIATDRQSQIHEAASLIPVFYNVQAPGSDEPQNSSVAVHRKTGMMRQLSSFRKPVGVDARERLQSFVSSLQLLSAHSDEVAKVFEVFEDYMNVHVLFERCTGGSVYERILERQYFTEQESAMIVKHMLQALVPFHENHLYHGSIVPDSFRFLNRSPHSPLKLVDFGIELKVHRWDAVESVVGGPDLQNPHCVQFFETCKLVFCAPEFAPPYQRKRRGPLSLLSESQDVAKGSSSHAMHATNGLAPARSRDGCGTGNSDRQSQDLLDRDLLADIIDEHADWFEQQQQQDGGAAGGYHHRKFAAGDVWSIGAIAFLLLCGYPPFFAPSRNAILGRIHRAEYSFDPPFWSKISEEAKGFVSSCLRASCWDRLSVRDALDHPWIQRLADTAPPGCLFSSFMLNLRRFYRTSLIEMYVANVLATRLCRRDVHEFLRRCKEIDGGGSGFFTASDLKHVLNALGHSDVADAMSSRFLRTFRHPGESYIDYGAMLDAIYLQQQRRFEEELWQQFQRVYDCIGRGDSAETSGWLPIAEVGSLFRDPVIVGMLMREVPAGAGAEAMVAQKLREAVQEHCCNQGTSEVEFHDLAMLLRRVIRSFPASPPLGPRVSGTTGPQTVLPMHSPRALDLLPDDAGAGVANPPDAPIEDGVSL